VSARPRAERGARTVAVAIVSDGRPEQLLGCLTALAAQTRPADEVIVVIRDDDVATRDALAARGRGTMPLRIVAMPTQGVVAARNAGLAACRSDVVAFCDDDTRAQPDWVARILAHFARDPELGGLGGRDRCHDGERFDDRARDVVGRIQWYGRTIGNHHLGHGAPREVRFLKGANMSFRLDATAGLAFDDRLRGRRIQAHEDFAFSMAVRRVGWKLLYDPAVALDHYALRRDQARRTYVAGRSLADAQDYFDQSYNYALALWDELPAPGRAVFAAWSLLVGTRVHPGLLQTVRLTPGEGRAIWRKFALCQRAIAAVYVRMAGNQETS
jgi:GT2 family glycosyltransferase